MQRNRRLSSHINLILIGGFSLAAVAACADPAPEGTDAAPKAGAATELHKVDTAASLVPEKYRKAGSVTVGGTMGMAPMLYLGTGDEIIGVEADILKSIGKVLDLDIKITETGPDAFMPGILSDRFQAAAGSITDTKERERKVDFVVYAEYGQGLFSKAGSDVRVTFDNPCGKSIGVLKGSVQQIQFMPQLANACRKQGRPKPNMKSFPDPNSLFLSARTGRVDAGFLNEISALYQVKHSKGKLEMADTGFGSDPKGIAVGKKTGLTKPFEAALRVLAKDGALDRIFKRWQIQETALPEPKVNQARR